jgi:hypothetical protein
MPKDTSSKPRGVGPSAGGPEALVRPVSSTETLVLAMLLVASVFDCHHHLPQLIESMSR